jgi:hypothetical protein
MRKLSNLLWRGLVVNVHAIEEIGAMGREIEYRRGIGWLFKKLSNPHKYFFFKFQIFLLQIFLEEKVNVHI